MIEPEEAPSSWPESYLAALSASEGKAATPKELDRVTRLFGAEAARWAFGQWALRTRAASKFTDSGSMFFVAEALEQASHERVASYHASLFPADELVVDLTCGIGSDLRAFAKRGEAIGVELDPERARCARANSGAEVIVGDCLEVGPSAKNYFCDPSRRDPRGRASADLSRHLPDPAVIKERFANADRVLIRLSPLVRDEDLRSLGIRCEFLSYGRSCREALVSFGPEISPAWQAVHLETGERLDGVPGPLETVAAPRPWVFDIDPAAARCGGIPALANRHSLALWGGDQGFLTGEETLHSCWLRPYQVLETGKFDLKLVKQTLAQRGWYTKTLKPRGIDISPEETLKKLPRAGATEVDLLVVKTSQGTRVAYCQPGKL